MTHNQTISRYGFSVLSVAFFLSAQSAFAQCNCGGGQATGMVVGEYAPAMPIVMGQPGDYSVPGGQVIESDSIYLTVSVPEKAILTVNGDPTISVGTTRYFVIKGLDLSREYKFEIVAETANAAGVAMEETKTVKVRPGSTEMVTLKPVKRKVVKKPAEEDAEKNDDVAAEGAAEEDAAAEEKSQEDAAKVTSRRLLELDF